MSERVTVNRKEFDAFLAENQAIVERTQKLIEKIDSLNAANKQLRDELQASKEKQDSAQVDLNVSVRQTDETIRSAREKMARLISETDRRISE
jgi:predicted  nucleic acid-binding Zn-ribbon protein